MNTKIRIGDNEFRIDQITSTGKKSEAVCEGKKYSLEFLDNGVLVNGKLYHLSYSRAEDGHPAEIYLDSECFPINIESIDNIKKVKPKKITPDECTIRARLCGKVISLSVEDGAEVKEGQLLLILEAMKMENEIRAPFNGRIVKIHAEPGKIVVKDELLLELMP